jgi:ADP-ribose pyrophosphatase
MDLCERELLGEGRFLRLVRDGRWEIAERIGCHGAVAIIAVTTDQRLVLTEQFRPAVQRAVIDLAAGLAGDDTACPEEPLLVTAQRELLEETGYAAADWQQVALCPSSPGLTSEIVTYFLATNATQQHAGGGDEHERITVHVPTLADIHQWIDERMQAGQLIDVKVYAALELARRHRREDFVGSP